MKLCSVASQWIYNDMCLPLSLSLSCIDGLVQIITSVKSGLDRPRFGVEGGGGRSMKMAIDMIEYFMHQVKSILQPHNGYTMT